MKLEALDIFHLRIPFSLTVKHSLAAREYSECFVIRIKTDSGTVGYGEGTPRSYVTGESVNKNIAFLKKHLLPILAGHVFTNRYDLLEFLRALSVQDGADKNPSVICALETALLDAAGKSWHQSIPEILSLKCKSRNITYGAVISILSLDKFERLLYQVKQREMMFLKLKVGGNSDLACLALTRKILGNDINIRVDANCAWTVEEATRKIKQMEEYGITAVEQPVAKNDFEGLRQVTKSVSVPIIADESLCSIHDAKHLADMKACRLFNIRLSKCGGFLNASKIFHIGKKAGIGTALGCHVGETGILSAAGRHFAQCFDKLVYIEGSFSSLLLKEDVIQEDLLFGKGGVASPLLGPGLGVSVREELLKRYAVQEISL